MRDVSRLTKEELIELLKELGEQNNNKEDFEKAVKETLPCVSAIITYSICGPMKMYMGMAMSHYHPGTIQF